MLGQKRCHAVKAAWHQHFQGVMPPIFYTMPCKEALSGEETTELLNFVVGQNADGYEEDFEQRPIKTPDVEIYVSFRNSDK